MPLLQRVRNKLHIKRKDNSSAKNQPENTKISTPLSTNTATKINPEFQTAKNPTTTNAATEMNQVSYTAKPSTTTNVAKSTVSKAPRSPGSVTLEERMRYQRIVLGMSEAQIRNALPPGQYDVRLAAEKMDRPSGRGDLAYGYLVPSS